jgi:hypothetical protein
VHPLRFLEDAIEVALANGRIEVETELRGLHRDLRVEAGTLHAIEHVDIVLGDLLGFLELREVLAEARQDCGDPLRLQCGGGPERIVDLLARHESRDRLPDERAPGRLLAQPGRCRSRQQHLPHQ